MTNQSALLVLDKICKSFGEKQVFNGLSHSFLPGCYALTGPNGVGKSTLLSLISGSDSFDSGRVVICGADLKSKSVIAKKSIAFVPDKSVIFPFMTGREFISLISRVRKIKDLSLTEKLLSDFRLDPHYSKPFSDLSLGTQKKMLIVAALIGEPAVLLMDEPTNAIDDDAKSVLINYLHSYRSKKVILCSTHDEDFISRLSMKKIKLSDVVSAEFS
jgi:ABC-2 type transport system ATP-binding protein